MDENENKDQRALDHGVEKLARCGGCKNDHLNYGGVNNFCPRFASMELVSDPVTDLRLIPNCYNENL